MIVIWGSRLYGKVDQVPGRCHVATQFFHLYFVPLVPMGSYVVAQGVEDGISIPLSGKSVFAAWTRTVCLLMVVVGVFVGLAGLAGQPPNLLTAAIGAGLFLVGTAGAFAAHTNSDLNQASYERAVELCETLGLSIEQRARLDLEYDQITHEECQRRIAAHKTQARTDGPPPLSLAEAAALARSRRESARLGPRAHG